MTRKKFDIRAYKRGLREDYKRRRREMDSQLKAEKDACICREILSMWEYRRAKTLLVFVSTPSEVDTHALIRQALEDGKQVAVPYCIDGTRNMVFYSITSLEELVPRTFGVLEPVPEKNKKCTDFRHSICILPGLTFDRAGYRLGYGGGYYDRFLSSKYKDGITLGVCYSDFVHKRLMRGRYDAPCKFLATDKGVRKMQRQQIKGESP